MKTLSGLLGEERAEILGRAVVDVMTTVYAENALRHDPLQGDDNLTYSVHVWRNSWFQMEERLDGVDFLRITRPNGSFQIDVAGFVIHVYKCGRTFEDVLGARFDKGQTRISLTQANDIQLSIYDDPTDIPDAETFVQSLRHLVIAHCGSPENGCEGVFIGAPVAQGVDGTQWWWLDPLVDDVSQGPTVLPLPLSHLPSTSPSEPEIALRLREGRRDRVADAHGE